MTRHIAALVLGACIVSSPALAQSPQPTRISAGFSHTCVRASDGSAYCWGSNTSGELGDGTLTDSPIPVRVSGLTGVSAVAAGNGYTCALLQSGSVRCWGNNGSGQLGDGTTSLRTTPVTVLGLSNVAAIAASSDHTCAVLGSGGVRCWGFNQDGQLGDGTQVDRTAPVAVSGITNAVAVEVGASHTCMLLATGEVRCVGANVFGQLGTSAVTDLSLSPVTVTDMTATQTIALGWDHGCGLQASGNVRCWGYNFDGELGDSTRINRATSVAVTGLPAASKIATHYNHGCAVLTDGRSVRCWGLNDMGQLGDGTSNTFAVSPVAVSATFLPISELALGQSHSCALQLDGGVYCWGGNFEGQLGTGDTTDMLAPRRVLGLGPLPVPWGAGLGSTALAGLLLSAAALSRCRMRG